MGVEKPDFKMYNKILEKLDVTSEESLFVGDSLKKDVLGSIEYGMKALWYSKTDNDECQSIQDFNELLEILKNDRFK